MKKHLFLAFTVISLNVCGQSHFLGARSGVNMTNISSSNSTIITDSRVGFSGGLSYDYLWRDRFSIGVDIIFNQRGFTNDFIVEDGFGNPTGRIITTKFEYDYLSFPVKAGTYFGKKAFGFGQIGVMPSMMIESETIPGSDAPSMNPPVTKFDFAGIIELGAGYKLNRFWLSLSAFYHRSFTTFTDFDNFGDANFRHKGLTLLIGLKYQLRKA